MLRRSLLVFAALLSTQSVPAATRTAPSEALPLGRNGWPVAKKGAPSRTEWATAEPVLLTRVSGARAVRCSAHATQGWLKVRCPELHTSAITQLASEGAAVVAHIEPAGDDRIPGGGEVVFPILKGDRHALLWWTLGEGYDGPLTVVPGLVLQEYWLGAEPVVLLSDALNEPVPTAKSGK